MWLWLLVSVVLFAAVIRTIGGSTSSLQVKEWGAAVAAAIALTVVGWLLAGPLEYLEGAVLGALMGSAAPPAQLTPEWTYATYLNAGFLFLINTVLFFLVAL